MSDEWEVYTLTSSCVQIITVEDNTAPTVTCSDFTATFDGCPGPLGPNTPNGNWAAVPASGTFLVASGGTYIITVDLNGCVIDNCADFEDMEWSLHSSYSENRTDCAVTLVNEISLRDECGNVAADRIITRITVQDNESPTVTCSDFTATYDGCPGPLGPNTPNGSWVPVPASGTFLAASGGIYSVTVNLNGCVTDNCSDLDELEWSLHSSYEENRTDCAVTLVNEISLRDECGNISPERVITRITVEDNEPPTPMCNDIEVRLVDGTYTLTAADAMAIGAGSTDNCGIDASMSGVPATTYTIADIGDNPITYTAYDNCGNTGTCDAIVTVICPLVVDCSNIFDQTISCRADLPPVNFDLPIIDDSCGDVILSALTIIPGNSGCPGDEVVITRTYFVQDEAGNQAQCMQSFTVISNDGPTITCPAGGNVECAANISVSATDAIVSAECGTPTVQVTGPIIVGSPDCPGTTYTYTYTVTDFCGRTASCTQQFVIANDAPQITCPADMTVECFADINPNANDAVVNVSCGVGFNTIVSGPIQTGQSDCFGTTYLYTYTVTDDCGRTASCDQLFTIQNSGPIVTCPAPITVSCASDINVDPSDVSVVTSCGLGYTAEVFGPNVYDGTPDYPGARYVYRYHIYDDCGRFAECARDIFIENEGPTISCIGSQTITCADEIIFDLEEVATYTTSCGQDVDFDVSEASLIQGQADCTGAVYRVEYTVTDVCGRSVSCSIDWLIQNEGPRVVTCLPDRSVECPFDLEDESSLLEVITDCELGYNIDVAITDFQNNCPGAQAEIVYTITDDCGRSTTCVQGWRLESPPFVVYPPETIELACIDGFNPDILDAEVYSPCGLDITKSEIIGPIYDEDKPLCTGSVVNYLYSFYDECGRMICEAQSVIINPAAMSNWPIFANQNVSCDEVPAVETEVLLCGELINLTMSSETITIPGVDDYAIVRTYSGEDACGNPFSFDQTIKVDCSQTSTSHIFCTTNENGWSDPMLVYQNAPYANLDLNGSDPLIIGYEGREIVITNDLCIVGNLGREYFAKPLPVDLGVMKVDGFNKCKVIHPVTGETYELFNNSLFSTTVALALNMRSLVNFNKVNLFEVCDEIDPNVLQALGVNYTVEGLYELAVDGLMGTYDGNLEDISTAIRQVIKYFEGCNEANCDESFNPEHNTEFKTGSYPKIMGRVVMHPNPAQFFTTVSLDFPDYEKVTTKIYSSFGEMVYEQVENGKGSTSINVSEFTPGLYHLVVMRKGQVIDVKKFVVQH